MSKGLPNLSLLVAEVWHGGTRAGSRVLEARRTGDTGLLVKAIEVERRVGVYWQTTAEFTTQLLPQSPYQVLLQ